jgi:hypothetical protein
LPPAGIDTPPDDAERLAVLAKEIAKLVVLAEQSERARLWRAVTTEEDEVQTHDRDRERALAIARTAMKTPKAFKLDLRLYVYRGGRMHWPERVASIRRGCRVRTPRWRRTSFDLSARWAISRRR